VNDTKNQPVRKTAKVTVRKPVNGSKTRKSPTITRPPGSAAKVVVVNSMVMEAAKKLMKPGQRLVIINTECVELRNG